MSASFPDLLISFEEAVEALKVKLSQDPSSSTIYNGEAIQSIAKDIDDKWAAISAMVQGSLVYETKAAMDTAGAPPEGIELAEVWRDTTVGYNGLYGWTGTAWEKSPYDTIKGIAENSTDIATLKNKRASYQTTFMKGFISFVDEDDPDYGGDGYFTGTGTTGLGSYKHTGLIPVNPGDKFITSGNDATGAYFDADGVQIWSVQTNGGVREVPDELYGKRPAYLKLAASNAKFDAGLLWGGYGEVLPPFKLNYGQEWSQFNNAYLEKQIELLSEVVTYNITQRKEDSVSPIATSFTDGVVMAIDKDDPDYGEVGYLGVNGIIKTSGYSMFQYMPVTPGVKIIISTNVSFGTSHIGWFDENKIWLGSESRQQGVPYVTPDNINGVTPKFFRVGCSDSNFPNAIVAYGDHAPDPLTANAKYLEPYSTIKDQGILNQVRSLASPIGGKIVAVFGDSITAPSNNWPNIFQQILGCEIKNYAVSGGHWEDFDGATTGQWFSTQVDNCLSANDNVEAIIIAMGTNSINATWGDFDAAISGDVGAVDTTVIWGGMRAGIERLKTKYPNIPICLVTQLQRVGSNPELGNFKIMTDNIKRIGAYIGCPVFDAGAECGISHHVESRTPTHLSDGLHTSESGKEMQGRYIAAKFMGMYTQIGSGI